MNTLQNPLAKITLLGQPLTMKTSLKLPEIIQGGMGFGVSNWRLAKAVSQQGQMGVVSGTGLDTVFARRLQLGDPGDDLRRALSHFPWQDTAREVLDTFFIPGGKSPEDSYKLISMPALPLKRESIDLFIVANFVEVFLAKEGHDGLVGINLLEKIQIPTLPSLLGAMLAGVDFILMGAGIPLSIPGVLDGLSRWETVEIKIHVEENNENRSFSHRFDPTDFCPGKLPELNRPGFLAIISSDIIAKTMVRKATGRVDGFIVEYHTAGGHNAPPRRAKSMNGDTSSKFGPKDIPNLERVKNLGKPFWQAGEYAKPAKLKEALDTGATGIQVGTVFAFCQESGVMPEIKQEALQQSLNGKIKISTDFQISPTGYPFKLVHLKNTISEIGNGMERKRICDIGYLRHVYCNSDNDSNPGMGYRCPGEPIKNYLNKGGSEEETIGKQCLCNGLLATIGLGQTRHNGSEIPIVTAGEDFTAITEIIKTAGTKYSAKDVINYLTR